MPRQRLSLEARAPVDEETGLPLPIAPRSDLASVPDRFISIHHGVFPRQSPLLTQTLGGRAMRVSRLQRLVLTQHNHGMLAFHHIWPEGPELPTTMDEQVGFCALAAAGDMPDQVVDLSRGERLVRTAMRWELERLREPGELVMPTLRQVKKYRDKWCPDLQLMDAKRRLIESRMRQTTYRYRNLTYGFDPLRELFVDFILAQDLSGIKRPLKNKFLNYGGTQDGLTILGVAAVMASESARVKGESFDVVYTRLRARGRLHHRMPPRAGTLLLDKLGGYTGRVSLLSQLRARLLGELIVDDVRER